MLTSLKSLNQALGAYDSALFAQETKPGRYDVYRGSKYGGALPNFIFALTDNWLPTGKPVSWSVDIVLNRIRAHDLWRDEDFVERLIAEQEEADASKQRGFRTSVEGFLSDFRRQFSRATNDVNTSLLKEVTHGAS